MKKRKFIEMNSGKEEVDIATQQLRDVAMTLNNYMHRKNKILRTVLYNQNNQ